MPKHAEKIPNIVGFRPGRYREDVQEGFDSWKKGRSYWDGKNLSDFVREAVLEKCQKVKATNTPSQDKAGKKEVAKKRN